LAGELDGVDAHHAINRLSIQVGCGAISDAKVCRATQPPCVLTGLAPGLGGEVHPEELGAGVLNVVTSGHGLGVIHPVGRDLSMRGCRPVLSKRVRYRGDEDVLDGLPPPGVTQ
jgi:hypothetical protein